MGEGNVRVLIVVSELFRGKVVVARDEEDDGVRHVGGWDDNMGSVGGKDSSRVLTAAWLPEGLGTEERQAFVVYQPHSMRRHHTGTERA